MILHFDQEPPIEIAGCKGHNLSRMWQAGLPVPAGFCVTWDGIDTVSSELSCALSRLQAASFAVRSSAIHEDARDASFAGVLVSRLNVTTTDSVLSALQDIRDSVSAPAALSYSRRLKVPHSPRIAAVVQTFLCAEASGILFMRDPQTPEGNLVVEACWGLGPAVVEGLVRPDRWIISTDGTVISSHIADKDIAVLPSEHEGTKQTSVDPACRRRPCLTLESLQQLSRLAAECERLFGSPQDIEWAVASGKVWLLQSRPITTSSHG